MPRNVNPGSLKVGRGASSTTSPSISGSGLSGTPPLIGERGTSPVTEPALSAHVQTVRGAHESTAIEHASSTLFAANVGGALEELSASVAPHPPFLGQSARHTSFSCIPDWGFLKLRDQSLEHFGLLTSLAEGASADQVFPYHHATPGPARDRAFGVQKGGDPRTDHLWNDGLETLGTVPGAGWGRTHSGAFTRDGDSGTPPLSMILTQRLYPRPTGVDAETGRPARVPVCLSGTIFPADRGVLALLHIPPLDVDLQTDFLAQPLVTDHTSLLAPTGRVVAALLLGNGLSGDQCVTACQTPLCDGTPGGIFAQGDPFAFPGRATGQYDLLEIHAGVDNLGGDPLQAPFDDLDGDSVAGAARAPDATTPAPGQVRLGTNPNAGIEAVPNGIPVLGASSAMYATPPTSQNGSLGHPIHGDALILDHNFFRYRLPVLADYSPETGLKWTPSGEDLTDSLETARFFELATPHATTYSDGTTVGASLATAGAYAPFEEDHWAWQVARYRQVFLMPSIAVDGDREEIGSYWLVHFKTEADFEKCARDGIFPWDVSSGYEVYGATLASTTHPEAEGNLANTWPGATPATPPRGPAPVYGYTSPSYHPLRASILMDPAGTALPAFTTATWDWGTTSSGAAPGFVVISGVYYFTPNNTLTGANIFKIMDVNIDLDPGFWTSYRYGDEDLVAGAAPAQAGSPNPMQIHHAPFAYGPHGSSGAASSLDLVVGASTATAHIPRASFQRLFRFELPAYYLGANAGGAFSKSNGPLDSDSLEYNISAAIGLDGDDETPSFSQDATLRVSFRRPLAHTTENTSLLPWSTTNGHGQRLTPTTTGTLLFHSTRFDASAQDGAFGNFLVNALGSPPNVSFAGLFTAEKDTYERFLDETYRLRLFWGAAWEALSAHGPSAAAHIVGPGMNGWSGGFLEVPVRAGRGAGAYRQNSWLLMEDHLLSLDSGSIESEQGLQVAGLPDRNPPISSGVQAPFPSAGVLLYPQKDYKTNYWPQHLSSAIGGAGQNDYSVCTGDRIYLRAFDLAFSHHSSLGSTPPVQVQGLTQATLRFDGITLDDILYYAPGPGRVGQGRMAIMAKVPGLTTWMDVGRPYGSGPSNQDPNLDGAGCLVMDITQSYNFTDPVTGYRGCYATIDVGPTASFFTNPAVVSSYTSGSPLNESPLLVKVQMPATAIEYNLEHVFSAGSFGAVRPGAAPSDVRGLIGIRVQHPDQERVPPDDDTLLLIYT